MVGEGWMLDDVPGAMTRCSSLARTLAMSASRIWLYHGRLEQLQSDLGRLVGLGIEVWTGPAMPRY